jgi:hypothetical protein
MEQLPESADFLSGEAGAVFGIRAVGKALVSDAVAQSVAITRRWPWRLPRAGAAGPRRRILALAIERAGQPNLLESASRELLDSRHDVHLATATAGQRGKFENLNALLAANPAGGSDWLVVVDDDVALPSGFLDQFIFLAERFQLRLAQPAHRARSHAAWKVTRRRAGSAVRETAFVEIGPIVAFHRVTFDLLLPFPELRIGWGLDLHWSAVARERGWKLGVVDATPIRHITRRIASGYDRADAVIEAERFLADRPYTKASEAEGTLVTHRNWA